CLRLCSRTVLRCKQQNQKNDKCKHRELPEIQPANQSVPPGNCTFHELLRLTHSLVPAFPSQNSKRISLNKEKSVLPPYTSRNPWPGTNAAAPPVMDMFSVSGGR